jgi:hypothetical protein
MPNWRRILVGDAFKLYSRDVNYYRDLALLWPFLLFSIIAISEIFAQSTTNRHRVVMAAIAIGCLILAKEKLVLLLASLGFVALRCVWAFAIGARELGLVVTLVVTVGLSAVILVVMRNRAYLNDWPEKTGTLDVLIGLGSLIGTIALKIWLDRYFV